MLNSPADGLQSIGGFVFHHRFYAIKPKTINIAESKAK